MDSSPPLGVVVKFPFASLYFSPRELKSKPLTDDEPPP